MLSRVAAGRSMPERRRATRRRVSRLLRGAGKIRSWAMKCASLENRREHCRRLALDKK